MERREFDDGDMDAMRDAAEVRAATAAAIDRETGRVPLNIFRPDRVACHVDGFKGEWAVADSLGVERPVNVSGRADDGTDLRAPCGARVAVRFTPYLTGRLMCPVNRPMTADVAVLVVGLGDRAVGIIGGTTVARFNRVAHLGEFGFGPTRWLGQDELSEWARVRAWLMGE